MSNIYNIHLELTSKNLIPSSDFNSRIYEFAKLLGWNPSYYIPADSVNENFANGYLSVEHGLENTAVLAFLNKPYNELNVEERKKLDNIAFNNLVSWLIPIDKFNYSHQYILNTQKRTINEGRIYPENFDNLRSEKFLQVIGKKPNPNILALDDSLISTISYWKRYISAEIDDLNNENLSILFNSIIFVRAIEDNNRRYKNNNSNKLLLIETFEELKDSKTFTIGEILKTSLEKLSHTEINSELISFEKLKLFDKLDKYIVYHLLSRFYETENNNFSYDFSIMTKHALSRVYEKYVSILNYEETNQLSLFKEIPIEKDINKFSGSFYTPEYIARFFSKFLLKEIPVNRFNNISICEPAVGSGMFLRTLLEVLYENVYPDFKTIDKNIFNNILGIDIDPNACHATKLSLSLLHLLIYDEIPKGINIINNESISYLKSDYIERFNVVISNPPFVRYEHSKNESIKEYLGNFVSGKTDLYYAFLKLSIEILKPDGYGLFVLPHSFLVNKGVSKIRDFLYEKTNIRFIGDLSSIPVFGDVSTYIILIIFQKKGPQSKNAQPLKLRCKNQVGKALEDVLNELQVTNDNYSIYYADNDDFSKVEWSILPSTEYLIEKKFQQFSPIDSFLDISSGIITGADNVFIIKQSNIPKGEEQVYKPYLSDKVMTPYAINENQTDYIFYPFINSSLLTQSEIESNFPRTWEYLLHNKKQLESRKSLPKEWWMLRSPSTPDKILVPKIINPELSITPKFSIDNDGKYVVSHSSIIRLKKNNYDVELLYFFLGILNSTPCYWYISNHSNKYNSGYNKIQPKTLKNTPTPDPFEIEKNELIKFIKLVKERINAKGEKIIFLEKEIDIMACRFYKLTDEESNILLGR